MKSWLAQGSSSRRVTLLPGTTFLHINRALDDLCAKKFVCKMPGWTGLHDSYGSWHLYICRFLFGLSILLSLHSCYEGHSVLFCKEKIEPLDRVMANIKRSYV